ncbi:hypothetical protein QCE62_00150 [Caballeronia sp. LZ033]|uniref:hypothetical protein n=1 Tax=Caballeronia sp. LZ033 TaxID=3038566 RepID=UPI00285683D6|nr:hypothetical protein [Caballeronia sp. LZ033]MDR5811998.1 hypothetical protein [Caballeronia sp. LZ033]
MKFKVCSKCKGRFPETAQHFHLRGPHRPGFDSRCIECKKADSKARRRAKPLTNMLAQARWRSRRDGREFSITSADVHIPDVCPVLGIPIYTGGTYGNNDNSPSLDRIDSTKGYIAGNVVVISNRANTLKRDATPEELVRLAQFYTQLSDR